MWHDAIMLGVFSAAVALVVPWLVHRRVKHSLNFHHDNLLRQNSRELAAYMAGQNQHMNAGFDGLHTRLNEIHAHVGRAIESSEAAASKVRNLETIAGAAEMCAFCGLIVAKFECMADGQIRCENCRQRGVC